MRSFFKPLAFNMPSPKYAWKKEWFIPYISNWALIERFKAANCATNADFVESFKIADLKKAPKNINLLSLSGLSEEKLEQLFHTSPNENTSSFISHFIRPFLREIGLKEDLIIKFNSQEVGPSLKLFCRELRLCQECLSYGFHSLFHQFPFISLCPYHLSQLFSHCPNCNSLQRFETLYFVKTPAFTCRCGYSFLNKSIYDNPKTYSEVSKKWDDVLLIKDKSILKWNKLSAVQLAKLNAYFFDSNAFIQMGNESFQHLLRAIDSKENILISDDFPYKLTTIEASLFTYIDKNNSDLDDPTYHELTQIFKSIARQIRKRVHRSCRTTSTKCAYSIAYFFWRNELEMLEKLSENQNPYQYFVKNAAPIFQIGANRAIRYILPIFSEIPLPPISLQLLRRKVIMHIFVLCLLSKYNYWLNKVTTQNENGVNSNCASDELFYLANYDRFKNRVLIKTLNKYTHLTIPRSNCKAADSCIFRVPSSSIYYLFQKDFWTKPTKMDIAKIILDAVLNDHKGGKEDDY